MEKTISYSVSLRTITNNRTGKESKMTIHSDFESIALKDACEALGGEKIASLNDLFINYANKAYFAFTNYEDKTEYIEIPLSQYLVSTPDEEWCKKLITRNAEIKLNNTTIVEITRYVSYL